MDTTDVQLLLQRKREREGEGGREGGEGREGEGRGVGRQGDGCKGESNTHAEC